MKKLIIPAAFIGLALVIGGGYYIACVHYGMCDEFFGRNLDKQNTVAVDTVAAEPAPVVEEVPVVATYTPPKDIQFQYGTALFLNQNTVAEMADYVLQELQADPSLNVELVGHTCSIGTDLHNENLAARRAAVIKSFFIRQGIPAKKILTTSRGEENPEINNDSEAHRELNRRVEVVLK